jgi:hypothetical protein
MLDGLFWFDAQQWAVNFLCIAGLQLGLRYYPHSAKVIGTTCLAFLMTVGYSVFVTSEIGERRLPEFSGACLNWEVF